MTTAELADTVCNMLENPFLTVKIRALVLFAQTKLVTRTNEKEYRLSNQKDKTRRRKFYASF